LHAQLGDSIEEGDALMTLYTDTPEKFERAIELASGAVDFSQQAPPKREMILGRVS
jgi:thymidine phosphorylase